MFTLSRTILLFLAIPSVLVGMEQSSSDIPTSHFSIVLNQLTVPVKNETETLYNSATDLLNSFKQTEEFQVKKLINFMETVQNFKKRNPAIDEHYLGSLAFTKETNFRASLGIQVSPCHVALFFKRLGIYHSFITDQNKMTPTIEELRAQAFNRGLIKQQEVAIKKAAEKFGIVIDPNRINYNLPPFQVIVQNVATGEFKQLCEHIEEIIRCKEAATFKVLADLIFLNISGFVQTSETNFSNTDTY